MEKFIAGWRLFRALSDKSNFEKIKEEINQLGLYDLHDILSQQKKIEWCEWHLSMNENDKAIEIAKEFHQNFQKLKLSSSVKKQIMTIEKTFLEFVQEDNHHWRKIKDYFKEAYKQDDPLRIIQAYTYSKSFSKCLNKHSAVNTYHALKLYCTLLNCPILAQTQQYTDAFTKILFHPKLAQYLVRNGTFYRGLVLEDEALVEKYKKDMTIITTTFLSTSKSSQVATIFPQVNHENEIGIFCKYNINNIKRSTALDLSRLSVYPDEEEILILRYVPFTIKSIELIDNSRRMTICFDECQEENLDLETLTIE